jgi:hypothetical protein
MHKNGTLVTSGIILIILVCFCLTTNAQNQRVGVGTTNPSDALHIKGDTTDHPLRVQVGNATKLRVLKNGGTTIGTNNTSTTPVNGLYVQGNTGLGIGNPADRLHVNGDLNLNGMLKANGISGDEGQMLVATGSGGLDWVDQCDFKNFKDFFNPATTHNWTVPAGVDHVIFELWGAGGGGGASGGGASGSYVKLLLDVTPGNMYTITVGEGGNGQTTIASATNGSASFVIGPGIISLSASGGGAGTNFPGLGGSTPSVSTGMNKAIRQRGANGHANSIAYTEYASGSFASVIHFGEGGKAFNGPEGGTGAVEVKNTVSGAIIYTKNGRPGMTPGGGGGGNPGTTTSAVSHAGANGYVIVRW